MTSLFLISVGSNTPVNINLNQRPGGVTLDLTFDAQRGPAQVKKLPPKPKIYTQEPMQSRSSLPPPPKDTRPLQPAQPVHFFFLSIHELPVSLDIYFSLYCL